MAITINRLNTGTLTISNAPAPTPTRTATRVWYGDDESVYTDFPIEGAIECDWDEY